MNRFKKRNIYVHHYASHTQSQNILRTENSYEDRCFMLTEILTNWIMATALRVAKMLPKATKYPLFWSWQKSPAYCTCQFEKNICTNQTLFSHVNLLLYLLRYLNLDPHQYNAYDNTCICQPQTSKFWSRSKRVRGHAISMYMYNIWTNCLFCLSGD